MRFVVEVTESSEDESFPRAGFSNGFRFLFRYWSAMREWTILRSQVRNFPRFNHRFLNDIFGFFVGQPGASRGGINKIVVKIVELAPAILISPPDFREEGGSRLQGIGAARIHKGNLIQLLHGFRWDSVSTFR
jgi:hypothetical protein